MKAEFEEVINEMYDEAFDYKQSFDYAPAAVLNEYADKLTKILDEIKEDEE